MSGQEQRVKDLLEERVRLAELSDAVRQVLLPTQTIQEVRGGKKRILTRKFYPGYLLVEAALSNDVWQVIKRTQGVMGFLGGERPTPLSTAEASEMLEQIESSKEKIAPRVMFKTGDRVKINDGPFINFVGVVETVDEERGKLGVSVSVFGRTTPVELEYWQVEKEE